MKPTIPIVEPFLGEEELDNVIEAVRSGWISSQGNFILEFERRFAAYCGARHAVATANGTVALHLALKALGLGQGDEVLVPALTFIASANAVTYCSARPVFVDSHPDYWCMDPARIEESITKRTKAIMPVHLYGHPCDMNAILDIARRHKLYVIEDAAEAHGALYEGRRVGSFGDINCFSFYANKIITTGEGGMCLTDDEELASRMRILRDHGMNPRRRYWHDVVGFNYRMTNLQAAIGVAQVDKLDRLIGRRRQLAEWYSDALRELAAQWLITLSPEMPWAKSIYWMYSILLEDGIGISRDDLIKALSEKGIETRPLFYPLHLMPPYQDSGRFPVAEHIGLNGINLPSSHRVSVEQVAQIAKAITEVCASRDSMHSEAPPR